MWRTPLTGDGTDAAGAVAALALLAVPAWVSAMSVRLLLAGGWRLISGWCLASSVLLSGVATLLLLIDPPSAEELSVAEAALWAGAVALLTLGAAHHSSTALTARARHLARAQLISRITLPGVALTVPPVAAIWQNLQGRPTLVTAVASLLVSLVVIWRYAALMVERARVARDLHRQAWRDELTGLANRASFYARCEETLRTGASCGLLFMDLDGFKAINDRWGHVVGDQVLEEVARRLAATTRPPDLVARLAGDEFVVLLCGGEQPRAEDVADRLRDVLATPMQTDVGSLEVGVSIGAAWAAGQGGSDKLVSDADAAMYRDKRRRRLVHAGAHIT